MEDRQIQIVKEISNENKINAIKNTDEFIAILKDNLLSNNPEHWDKVQMDFYQRYNEDKKNFQQPIYITSLMEEMTKFLKKNAKLEELYDDSLTEEYKVEKQKYLSQFCYHVYYSISQLVVIGISSLKIKQQREVIIALINVSEQLITQTSIQGTIGGQLTEFIIQTITSQYEAIQHRDILKKLIDIVPQIIQNSEANISSTLSTFLGLIVLYARMNFATVIKGKVANLWKLGLEYGCFDILCHLSGATSSEFENICETTYDQFINIYENELTVSQRMQIQQYFEVLAKKVPNKLIENVDFLIDSIDSQNKYFALMALKELSYSYPDRIMQEFEIICEVAKGDPNLGYVAIQIIGILGQKINNGDTTKHCISTLLIIAEKNLTNQQAMVGIALTDIFLGGPIQKKIMLQDYFDRIILLKQSGHSQLVEHISKLELQLSYLKIEQLEIQIKDLKL